MPTAEPPCRYLYSGRIRAPRGRVFEPHAHPSHEVVVVRGGTLKVQIGGRSAVAGPGGILWYDVGEMHHESVPGPGSCDWHYLLFTGPACLPGHQLLVQDADGNVRQLTAMIAAAAGATDEASARKRDALCDALHAELARLRAGAVRGEDGLVAEANRFIASRLANPLQLEQIARATGLSRAHFARVYRQRTGITVMVAVRNARLAAARELLLTTRLTVADIADRTGLRSQPHLSRLLASRLGVGARALRRGSRIVGFT